MATKDRTPPVRLSRSFLEQLADLGPNAGAVIQIGIRDFDGAEPVALSDAPEILHCSEDEARGIALAAARFLDPDELARGRLSVEAFREAGAKSRKVSKVRASAAHTRHNGRSKKPGAEFVKRLTDLGVSPSQAEAKVAFWMKKSGAEVVAQAFAAAEGKALQAPLAYIDRVFTNLHEEKQNSSARARRPVPVRRNIPATGRWDRIGWAAEGGPTSPSGERKIAWRTDTGRIRWLRAEPGEEIPSFTEEPGVYEID